MEQQTEAQKKFSKLSFFGKIKHVGKVVVFLITFGFVFPHIFND